MSNFINENIELLINNYFFLSIYFIVLSLYLGATFGVLFNILSSIKKMNFIYIRKNYKIIIIIAIFSYILALIMKHSPFLLDFNLSILILISFSFIIIFITKKIIKNEINDKISTSYDHNLQCKKINKFLDLQIKKYPATIYSNVSYFRELSKYPQCKIILLKEILEDISNNYKTHTSSTLLFLTGATTTKLIPEWPNEGMYPDSIIFILKLLFIGTILRLFLLSFYHFTNNPSEIEKKINILNYYLKIVRRP